MVTILKDKVYSILKNKSAITAKKLKENPKEKRPLWKIEIDCWQGDLGEEIGVVQLKLKEKGYWHHDESNYPDLYYDFKNKEGIKLDFKTVLDLPYLKQMPLKLDSKHVADYFICVRINEDYKNGCRGYVAGYISREDLIKEKKLKVGINSWGEEYTYVLISDLKKGGL